MRRTAVLVSVVAVGLGLQAPGAGDEAGDGFDGVRAEAREIVTTEAGRLALLLGFEGNEPVRLREWQTAREEWLGDGEPSACHGESGAEYGHKGGRGRPVAQALTRSEGEQTHSFQRSGKSDTIRSRPPCYAWPAKEHAP